jgi:ketosteroid isomerase-like protein
MQVEQNIQTIQKLYQSFGQGDMPGVLNLISPEADFIAKYGQGHFPGQWGKPTHGHNEIIAFFQAMGEAVEVQRLEPYKFFAEGDDVVVLLNWQGVIRKSGQTFDSMLVHIWTVGDGKVTKYIGLADPTAYSF